MGQALPYSFLPASAPRELHIDWFIVFCAPQSRQPSQFSTSISRHMTSHVCIHQRDT